MKHMTEVVVDISQSEKQFSAAWRLGFTGLESRIGIGGVGEDEQAESLTRGPGE